MEDKSEKARAKREEYMREFERMRNLAELRALSSVSLERPLNDVEFDRIMELKREVLGG